jgi:hypothetical protein
MGLGNLPSVLLYLIIQCDQPFFNQFFCRFPYTVLRLADGEGDCLSE